METKAGCLICGKELHYSSEEATAQCVYCNNEFTTQTMCQDGHFICDHCHSSGSNDIIEQYCINSPNTDPITMATEIMKHPSIPMHGPEHHFLVPAVLLSAFYNKKGTVELKKEKIKLARTRSEQVPGGTCGFWGACGAGIGGGIFQSISTEASPLSQEQWKEANAMTARCLSCIADNGGPRCCKRDTYLAISEVWRSLNWPLPQKIECTFMRSNKQCLGKACLFHPMHG